MSFRGVVSILACLWATSLAANDQSKDGYELNPHDRIKIGVVEWFPVSGDFRSLIAGEFMVSPSGTVSLPLLGEVEAAGTTASQLAEAISGRLRGRLQLEARTNTSVEVVQFRPLYVAGAVEGPGGAVLPASKDCAPGGQPGRRGPAAVRRGPSSA